jgi:hypothetical protein
LCFSGLPRVLVPVVYSFLARFSKVEQDQETAPSGV